MTDCRRFAGLLPLLPGGELSPEEASRVQGHLAGCASCREEFERFSQVISLARTSHATGLSLPSGVRNRIALEAAKRASRRSWSLGGLALALGRRPGLLASAAAAVLALGILPAVMRHGTEEAGRPEVSRIDVTVDGGTVRLAWTDGSRDSYIVYKGTDPRDLNRTAEAHEVTGNSWTDREPASSPIVYYKIE